MSFRASRATGAAIALAAGVLSIANPASARTYILSQLLAPEPSGYQYVTVTGLNESGQVSGVGVRTDGTRNALFWGAGVSQARAIQPIGSIGSVANGINESGQIVGTQKDADGTSRAFTYSSANDSYGHFLGAGSVGNAINDAGVVVGGISGKGYLFDGNDVSIYSLPSNVQSAEFSFITNDGHIIGERVPVPEPINPNPLVLQRDVFVMNNALGTVSSDPFSLIQRSDFVAANNAGQYAINISFPQSPFFVNYVSLFNIDGTQNPAGLGVLPGDSNNYGGGFNDLLDFVGESYSENRYGGSYGDAIITTGGGTFLLSSLVSNLGANFLQQGALINNRGQIAAFGYDALGHSASYLLTPEDLVAPPGVPEAGSWALMIAGFGLVGSSLRRRGRGGGEASWPETRTGWRVISQRQPASLRISDARNASAHRGDKARSGGSPRSG